MRDDLIELVPVPFDGAARCRRVAERRRRRTYLLSASTLVALAVLAFVSTVVRPPGRLDTARPGPVSGTVVPAPYPVVDDGAPLPLAPAALAARPAVPPGWRTVAFGLVQLAVPGDWVVVETAERPGLCGTDAGTALADQDRPVVSLGGAVVGRATPDEPETCYPILRFLRIGPQRNDCAGTLPCTTTAVNGLVA